MKFRIINLISTYLFKFIFSIDINKSLTFLEQVIIALSDKKR